MARVSPGLGRNGNVLGHEAYEGLDEAELGFTPDPRIVDLTARADRRHRKGTRDPKTVYALVLHQMACCFRPKDPLQRFLTVGAHFAITSDGRILQLHPVSALVWASNGFNARSVAVEFAGNFPNVRSTWWKGDTYGRNRPTPAQIDAGRHLVRYLKRTIGLTHVLAHRQSSGTRENDPGPDIWFNVGQWAIDTLGLKDGGPDFKIGTGMPIPAQWRTWGRGPAAPERETAWDVESPDTEIAHDTELAAELDEEVDRNSGAYIRWVQQSLNTILGLQMPVDGIRGPMTRSAIRSFQQRRGLTVDGVVGPQTEGALIAAGAGNPPRAASSAHPAVGSSSSSPTAPPSFKWALPPDVSAAGEHQFIRYDGAPPWNDGRGCATSLSAGARALGAYIRANFPGVRDIGGLACRPNTANAAQMSVHGSGRALDIMIPPIERRANSAVGDPIANWLVQNAERLGVQYIIWNRTQWRGRGDGRRDSTYTGPNPHADHIHVELNRDGAARSTPSASFANSVGAAERAPTSSSASPAPGQRRPVPAGYRPARRPTPAVVAKANGLLRSSHPIGTHIPLTLDDKNYLFAVEWHKHAATDPVPESLKRWHRGITVYEKDG